MDMTFRPEDYRFRDEVRAWIRDAMPEPLRKKAEADGHFEHHEIMEWHKILYRKGWVAPHWPKEYGGPRPRRHPALHPHRGARARGRADAVGPSVCTWSARCCCSLAPTRRSSVFLPKILSGEEVWCQGYSEPNAGSDLASLRTRADDDGAGHFVINGQKTWTTYAQFADWIFALVRTDNGPGKKKQEGISFILIDMKSPGLVAKPFLTIGGTPAFAETFLRQRRRPQREHRRPAQRRLGPSPRRCSATSAR